MPENKNHSGAERIKNRPGIEGSPWMGIAFFSLHQ
jgi:hypothetical protein